MTDKQSFSFNANAVAFIPGQSFSMTNRTSPPPPPPGASTQNLSDENAADLIESMRVVNLDDQKAEYMNGVVDDWQDNLVSLDKSLVNGVEEEEPAVNTPAESISEIAEKFDSRLSEAKSKVSPVVIEPDPRPHLNIVFIGHVDAGKSTTCGNILYLTGHVDDRTIEKYEKEAKEKNRESWFLAFIMDTNEEERQKGKTVEVGRAAFTTKDRRFTILDAPGHKSFVPNMISGAAQADIAVLIISARKGEFETGFEKGGQTREHALLAKTLGVNYMIVAVNKMDDSTCSWSQERYDDIERKLVPYLKSCGYNPSKDITFIPVSGLTGQNLMCHVSDPSNKRTFDERGGWWGIEKPTLFQILNGINPPPRDRSGPVRIPLLDGYRDNGVLAVGKVESGTVRQGMNITLLPGNLKSKVLNVYLEGGDDEVSFAYPGENLRLKLSNVEEDQVCRGMVICSSDDVCRMATFVTGRVAIVELLEHKPLITAGYSCILHSHTASEEVSFLKLIECTDKKTKKKSNNPQFVKGDCMVTIRMQLMTPMCLEPFETRPQLGRFTLRDEGKTVAIGKVLELETSTGASA